MAAASGLSQIEKGGEKMKSIGIDIRKRRCIVCIMDRNGTVLEETGYENTYAAATALARKARREYGKCQAVCESTGNLWIKTYEAFEDRGIPIEPANPMKVRAIAEASVKTDKVDARTLAHLLRTSLIARCHVAERGVRGMRQLLRERTNQVKGRTQTINRLHNLLDRYDLSPKDLGHDIWREKVLRILDSRRLQDPNDDHVLHQYVRDIRHRNAELGMIEKKTAIQASASEDAKILMSMTGIDYYTAMLLASEIDGVGRFASPKKLVSWVGMCPTVHRSGDTLYYGRIKKDSNRKANWILTQAANVAIQHDERMKRYYEKVRKAHHHNIAITHVANKMTTIIWHMLTNRTLYSDRNGRLYQKKLKRLDAVE